MQAGLAEVQEKLRAGRTASMTGVPHFIINNKLQVGGAQSPEVFQEAFRRVLASA
jgi:predicted DsbA family dithiol-disulfide isomerase